MRLLPVVSGWRDRARRGRLTIYVRTAPEQERPQLLGHTPVVEWCARRATAPPGLTARARLRGRGEGVPLAGKRSRELNVRHSSRSRRRRTLRIPRRWRLGQPTNGRGHGGVREATAGSIRKAPSAVLKRKPSSARPVKTASHTVESTSPEFARLGEPSTARQAFRSIRRARA